MTRLSMEDPYTLKTEIEDTGLGISSENQKKLFKYFGKIHSQSINVGGLGLGLQISKNICEKLGGGISLKSEVDKGSTFSFKIKSP